MIDRAEAFADKLREVQSGSGYTAGSDGVVTLDGKWTIEELAQAFASLPPLTATAAG